MNLFGCMFCKRKNNATENDVTCDRKNFDSLLWAIVTVFQVPGKLSGYIKCIFQNVLNMYFKLSLSS